MKKLKKFANRAAYENYISTSDVDEDIYPLVAYIEDTRETIMNSGYDKQYLTMEMLENGTLQIINNSTTTSIYYKINNSISWESFSKGNWSVSVNKGDKIKFRGNYPTTYNSGLRIKAEGSHKIYGCLTSLCYEDNFVGQSGGTYVELFSYDNGLKDAENLILPIDARLSGLFANCYNLSVAPKTITLTGRNMSADYMFQNCFNMKKAPIVDFVNGGMRQCGFINCDSLKRIDVKNLQYSGHECGNPFNMIPEYVIYNESQIKGVLPEVFINATKTNIEKYEITDPYYIRKPKNINMYCDDFGGWIFEDARCSKLEKWFQKYGFTSRCYKLIGEMEYNQRDCLLWMLDNPIDAHESQDCLNMASYIVTDGTDVGNLESICIDNYNEIDSALRLGQDPDISQLINPILGILNCDLEGSGYDVDVYFANHCVPYLLISN